MLRTSLKIHQYTGQLIVLQFVVQKRVVDSRRIGNKTKLIAHDGAFIERNDTKEITS